MSKRPIRQPGNWHPPLKHPQRDGLPPCLPDWIDTMCRVGCGCRLFLASKQGLNSICQGVHAKGFVQVYAAVDVFIVVTRYAIGRHVGNEESAYTRTERPQTPDELPGIFVVQGRFSYDELNRPRMLPAGAYGLIR